MLFMSHPIPIKRLHLSCCISNWKRSDLRNEIKDSVKTINEVIHLLVDDTPNELPAKDQRSALAGAHNWSKIKVSGRLMSLWTVIQIK